jgi:hypothetical protein
LRYCLLIIALSCVTISQVFSQDFHMLHYTLEDGLPSNTVYSIYRDSKGFLWIATDKGIARYNGIKFDVFTTFNGIPDNEVFFFQEDNEGRLWLATYNGELCYYKDDIFHTAANTEFLRIGFKTPFIKRIALQKDSSLTVSFYRSPKFINIKHEKITTVNLDEVQKRIPNLWLIEREKISENRYKLINWTSLLEVDSNGHILKQAPLPLADGLKEFSAVSFTQNQFFIITKHYVLTHDLRVVKKLDDTFFRNNTLRVIYHSNLGHFYASSKGILFNDSLRLLNGFDVSCVTQDNEGNYWVSTLQHGIFVIDKSFLSKKNYANVYDGKVQYANAQKGQLYFTTSNRTLFLFSEKKAKPLLNLGGYLSNTLNFLPDSHFDLIDSNSRYYYSDIRESIVTGDLHARPLKTTKYNCNLLPAYTIKAALAAGDSVFINAVSWVLGTDYRKYKAGDVVAFKVLSDDRNPEKIFGFAKSPDNSIWYTTLNSTFRIRNGISELQQQFKNYPFKAIGFFGDYLIGYSHYNKFFICKHYNDSLEVIPVADQNCIWDRFYRLDDNHVLISTNNYYRLLTLSLNSVAVIENPFVPLQAEMICADSSFCYFFKNGSIISIDIKSLLARAVPPKLYFSTLTAGKKSYRIADRMQIPFKVSKNLKISFATSSFSGNHVQYQYTVSENNHDNWVDAEREEINLVNPRYGNYTIKIRARTISSDFSSPIAFTIEISKPYWLTWWFITLSVSFIVLVATFIVFITRRSVIKTEKRRSEYLELELRSIYSQLNPHFIFNSLNSALLLVKTNRLNDAYRHIYQFSDLLRGYIKSSRNRFVSLSHEIANLRNYIDLQRERYQNKFGYEIIVDETIDTTMRIPSLLLQPLVENAIIHGLLNKEEKGHLKIEFTKGAGENDLICTIDDDGIGRAGSAKFKEKIVLKDESYGSDLIKDLIDILNKYGEIKIEIEYIDKKENSGTIVRIKFRDISG